MQDPIAVARKDPGVTFAFAPFRAEVAQLFVDVDRARAMRIGVPLTSVFGIFLTPVFHYAIQWATGGRKNPPATAGEPQPEVAPPATPERA